MAAEASERLIRNIFDRATLPAARSLRFVRGGRRWERYANGDLAIERNRLQGRIGELWTVRIYWKRRLVFAGRGCSHQDAQGSPTFSASAGVCMRGIWERRLAALYRRGTRKPRIRAWSRWRPRLP